MVYVIEGIGIEGTASRVHEEAAEWNTGAKPSGEVMHVRRGMEIRAIERACRRARRGTDIGHYQLAIHLSEIADRGLHQLVGCSSAVHFARAKLDLSRRQARDLIATGKAIGDLPQIHDAFCEGRLSWTKVRILCRIAAPETEKAWLLEALKLSCEALEKRTLGKEKGKLPDDDERGLPHVRLALRLKLDPLRYELWEQARKLATALAGEEVSESDAFAAVVEEFVTRARDEGSQAPRRTSSAYRVVVGLTPAGTDAWVATDDGPVAIERGLAEALACDASEIGLAPGVPPEAAQSHLRDRKTPESLRLRILERDRHACRHCQGRNGVHVHHVVFRSEGGPTEPWNLAVLCRACHTLVHDGFLTVRGRADGKLEFADRDGGAIQHARVGADEDCTRLHLEPVGVEPEAGPAPSGGACAPPPGDGNGGRAMTCNFEVDAPARVISVPRPREIRFQDLPPETPPGWWEAHAPLFSWSDRRASLQFTDGLPASPPAGGARAPLPLPDHRPAGLDSVVGQVRAVGALRTALEASRIRGKALPHVLFSGGPGLGKTALVRALAADAKAGLHLTSGPALTDPAPLIGLLGRVRAGDVVFVDEIHALPKPVAEMLYEAMEDQRLSLPVMQGVATRTLTLTLPPFTLAGATTDPDRMPAPLRSRCGLIIEMELYSDAELSLIATRAAGLTGLTIDPDAARALAEASNGIPRELLHLVARATDLAVTRSGSGTLSLGSACHHQIDLRTAQETLESLAIDARGLGPVHRRILDALRRLRTGSLSQSRLALAAAVSVRALREVYEPALIRLGLLDITPRGRRLSLEGAAY